MKKKKPVAKKVIYRQSDDDANMLSEPAAVYYRQPVKPLPSLQDFSYNDFKKIAGDTPFTQAEWAAMLHVSERTLQRYAKTNAHFAPINAERALQIGQLLKKAQAVLGHLDNFYQWLKRKPQALEGQLSLESLTSADGINKIFTQLGRIEHGLFA
jgi:putative toxin-antitoxin system antitoxin component (TIGR02293 family)